MQNDDEVQVKQFFKEIDGKLYHFTFEQEDFVDSNSVTFSITIKPIFLSERYILNMVQAYPRFLLKLSNVEIGDIIEKKFKIMMADFLKSNPKDYAE